MGRPFRSQNYRGRGQRNQNQIRSRYKWNNYNPGSYQRDQEQFQNPHRGYYQGNGHSQFGGRTMDVLEEVSTCTDMAGVILQARITINNNNIMLMMIMTKLLSNMVLHALYVVDTTTHLNIVTRVNMISMTSWKK